MAAARPDLRHERALMRGGARVVVGMDEVGRGALAGPVSVGAVAVDLSTGTCPRGVADSKLLTPLARRRLLPGLGRWGLARAVGHASAQEIDDVGIIAALRLAGQRALAQLGVPVDLVLLDGSHDWLSPPRQATLFDDEPSLDRGGDATGLPFADLVVRTKVKADRACSSVAAASVLAKCERDALMVALAVEHPAYAWQENKGYGAPEHLEALRLLGPCALHRRSWRLPVADVAGDDLGADGLVLAGGVGEEVAILLDGGGLQGRRGGVVGGPGEALEAVPVVEAGPRWSMMDA